MLMLCLQLMNWAAAIHPWEYDPPLWFPEKAKPWFQEEAKPKELDKAKPMMEPVQEEVEQGSWPAIWKYHVPHVLDMLSRYRNNTEDSMYFLNMLGRYKNNTEEFVRPRQKREENANDTKNIECETGSKCDQEARWRSSECVAVEDEEGGRQVVCQPWYRGNETHRMINETHDDHDIDIVRLFEKHWKFQEWPMRNENDLLLIKMQMTEDCTLGPEDLLRFPKGHLCYMVRSMVEDTVLPERMERHPDPAPWHWNLDPATNQWVQVICSISAAVATMMLLLGWQAFREWIGSEKARLSDADFLLRRIHFGLQPAAPEMNRRWKCQYCQDTFEALDLLEKHSLSVHGELGPHHQETYLPFIPDQLVDKLRDRQRQKRKANRGFSGAASLVTTLTLLTVLSHVLPMVLGLSAYDCDSMSTPSTRISATAVTQCPPYESIYDEPEEREIQVVQAEASTEVTGY